MAVVAQHGRKAVLPRAAGVKKVAAYALAPPLQPAIVEAAQRLIDDERRNAMLQAFLQQDQPPDRQPFLSAGPGTPSGKFAEADERVRNNRRDSCRSSR